MHYQKEAIKYETKQLMQTLLEFESKITNGKLKKSIDDPLKKALMGKAIRDMREWINGQN